MKVLYISENLTSPSGGAVGNKRNQKVLKEYFGQKSVFYKFLKVILGLIGKNCHFKKSGNLILLTCYD